MSRRRGHIFLFNSLGCFWCWAFVAVRLFSVAASAGCSVALRLVAVSTGPAAWLQWFWLPGSGAQVSSCGVRGLVAPKHVGSSRTWDQTRVSCIGRHVLYHWATREAWDHILTSDFCWNLGLRNSKWIFKILFTYLEVKMWYILKSHRHQFRLFPSHPSQPFQLNYSLYYLGIIDYTRKESALLVWYYFQDIKEAMTISFH